MSTTLVKHPLSLYDFMGYLIPGLYATWLIFTLDYILFYSQSSSYSLISLIHLDLFFNEKTYTIEKFIALSSIYVIFSFIIGQLISILSNIVIEELPYIHLRRHYFAIALNEQNAENRLGLYVLPVSWCKILTAPPLDMFILTTKAITNIFFWLMPIHLFLLPFILIFSPPRTPQDIKNKLSYFDNFFRLQPLGVTGCSIALKKVKEILFKHFRIYYNKRNCSSYFHYIYHFALEKCDSHIIKFNNYVALYGFMRNMLMGNIILFYYSMWAYYHYTTRIYLILLFGTLNVLFLYGYLKFIRRYTEEIIFAACAMDD